MNIIEIKNKIYYYLNIIYFILDLFIINNNQY